jgi:hypothetical protein
MCHVLCTHRLLATQAAAVFTWPATTMPLPPSTVRSCAHGVVLALVGAAQRKQPPLLLQAQQAQQDEVRLYVVTSPGHDWLAHRLRRACRPAGPMGPAPPTRAQHAHKV